MPTSPITDAPPCISTDSPGLSRPRVTSASCMVCSPSVADAAVGHGEDVVAGERREEPDNEGREQDRERPSVAVDAAYPAQDRDRDGDDDEERHDRRPHVVVEFVDKDRRSDSAFDSYRVDDSASLRASAGVSIFWDSPFGPIRFDFSQILAKEEYDRTESFRFSTNTRF